MVLLVLLDRQEIWDLQVQLGLQDLQDPPDRLDLPDPLEMQGLLASQG